MDNELRERQRLKALKIKTMMALFSAEGPPPTLAELAARYQCDPDLLHRLTHGPLISRGPSAAELDGLMLRARTQLLRSLTPLPEIIRDAGFGSYETFAAAFKRRYGCTPKECSRISAASSGEMEESSDVA